MPPVRLPLADAPPIAAPPDGIVDSEDWLRPEDLPPVPVGALYVHVPKSG
jgi:hypothetical protein